jgi:hypothetical protein
MDFLLSWHGLLYNGPALLLLAYLLWVHPAMGIIVAGLAGLRVLGPIAGLAQWIPFSVHMTLVGAAALAAVPSPNASFDWDRPLGLGAIGVGLLTAYVYLGVWDAPRPWGIGLLVGLGLGGLQQLVSGGLVAEAPTGSA